MTGKKSAFKFVEANKGRYPITFLVKVAGVSRAGYYKWRDRVPGLTRQERDKPLLIMMISLYVTHGGNLGHQRFKDELKNRYDEVVNLKRIKRMRRMYNLPLKTKRRNPRPKGKQPYGNIGNLLNRNFKALKPGIKFCVDITYLEILKPKKDFLFLCSIIDLYNNEVVAYSIGEHQATGLVKEAVEKLAVHGFEKGAILHSDQGVQFTNFGYQSLLKNMHLTQSMSRRGNCWDNACIESFFGKLKTEMPGFSIPETADEMVEAVTAYITYYNEERPQLKFKTSPKAYRLAS